MDFNPTDVGLRGRNTAAVQLTAEDTLVVTSNILKHNTGDPNLSIEISEEERRIKLLSDTMELFSNLNSDGDAESIVYGETLVEILRWFIQIMMTHTHPPNAPAINTFHDKAREYHRDMEDLILNKNIRTK